MVDLGLISNTYEIWETSGRTYGADRVHRQLRRDGIHVGRKRVERLMTVQGWQGAFLRARLARRLHEAGSPAHASAGSGQPAVHRDRAEPALGRQRHPHPSGEGVFWLAAVRDVFSRRIVGWKTSDRCDTDLILVALEYGIWSRDVRDGH